jgi:hypothetical protein
MMMSVHGTGPVTMTDGAPEGAGVGAGLAAGPLRTRKTTRAAATRMKSPRTQPSAERPVFFSVGMLGSEALICRSLEGWVGS